jgi:hypothetical protein
MEATTAQRVVYKRTKHRIVFNGEYAGAVNDGGIHWRLRLILRTRLFKIARPPAMGTDRHVLSVHSLTADLAGISRAQVATLRTSPKALCSEEQATMAQVLLKVLCT